MASPTTSSSILLLLPVADATRLARPDLNPGIARLRIERIAVASRELGSSRAARFLRARMRSLASGIGSGLDRNRREFRRRPKPLRRKYRLRKVEAEELVGTVLIRHRQAAPRQQRRAKHGGENIFHDHGRPSGMLGK